MLPRKRLGYRMAALVGLGFCVWVIAQSDLKTWAFVGMTGAISAGLYLARLMARGGRGLPVDD